MYRFYLRYKSVLLNAIILMSLIIAANAHDSSAKNMFIAFATGMSLINLGDSIYRKKERKDEINNTNDIMLEQGGSMN